MRRSATNFRPYLLTVTVLWVLGTVAAYVYARQKSIPSQVVAGALPALLLEIAMYAGAGFESVRGWLKRLRWRADVLLIASAVVPYLIMSLVFGNFRLTHLAVVAGLAAGGVYWHRVFPKHMAADLLFLGLAAAVYIGKIFSSIYVNPAGKPELDIVGRMMWIRLLVLVLMLRGTSGVEFGFVPNARQWRTGILYYLVALLPVLACAWLLDIVHRPVPWSGKVLLTAVGTFLGFLWVIALAEEFFFRGMLQPIIQRLTGSQWTGLLLTALLFGAVHLGFRGFPNWRFASVAAVCGVFYGLSYWRSKSVIAAAVTHALIVMTWRVFFI